jgi:hypothetical protein
MWNLIHCYLSGRHDNGVWSESGEMFLRCVHCGKRSSGWAVEARFHTTAPVTAATPRPSPVSARVVPFDRALATGGLKTVPASPGNVIPYQPAS